MKRNELIMFVKGNNINLKKYNIFVGEKRAIFYGVLRRSWYMVFI